MERKLLELRDYQLISQLSLAVKRRVAGLVTGEQRSPVQGGGIEFADYREYLPGDDIRQIDWTVFLRLRRLLVKLCAEEKELTLMTILDNSQSMRFGEPDKLWISSRIAAILSGIAQHNGNRAGILTMGRELQEVVRPERNQISLTLIIKALEKLEPVTNVDVVTCIRQFATRYGRKCLVVLLSDMLFPEWPKVIAGLRASGAEGYLIQVLAPEELSPLNIGEVTLVDNEGAGEVPLHIGQEVIEEYQKELAQFLQELGKVSRQSGLGHVVISSDTPLARIFHSELRKGGLLC